MKIGIIRLQHGVRHKEVGQNGMLRQVNLIIENRKETARKWIKPDITIQYNFSLEPKHRTGPKSQMMQVHTQDLRYFNLNKTHTCQVCPKGNILKHLHHCFPVWDDFNIP